MSSTPVSQLTLSLFDSTALSGGLTLDRARAVAETGVDFLAVGALTHSALVLDIAMDLRPPDPS